MAPWQARCVQGYIAANLHSTIRVMDLIRMMKFCPNRFGRVFKETFSCTPHQYIILQRIERAKSLMLMSKDTLAQIAMECGFVNQSHLSNLFRKIVGVVSQLVASNAREPAFIISRAWPPERLRLRQRSVRPNRVGRS